MMMMMMTRKVLRKKAEKTTQRSSLLVGPEFQGMSIHPAVRFQCRQPPVETGLSRDTARPSSSPEAAMPTPDQESAMPPPKREGATLCISDEDVSPAKHPAQDVHGNAAHHVGTLKRLDRTRELKSRMLEARKQLDARRAEGRRLARKLHS